MPRQINPLGSDDDFDVEPNEDEDEDTTWSQEAVDALLRSVDYERRDLYGIPIPTEEERWKGRTPT